MKKSVLSLFLCCQLIMSYSQTMDKSQLVLPMKTVNTHHSLFFDCDSTSSNFSGERNDFIVFNNDSIHMRYVYENGKKVLTEGYYLENNQLFRRLELKNCIPDGQYVWYYKHGQLKTLTIFDHDVESKIFLHWSKGGVLLNFEDLDYEKKRGSVMEWDEQGTLIGKAQCVWDTSDGTMKDTFTGIEVKKFYSSGDLKSEFITDAGIKQSIHYYENGSTYFKGQISESPWNKVGSWKYWHENGRLSKEIIYHDTIPNYPIGTWKYWNEKGELIKEEIYKEGKLIDTKTYIPGMSRKE